MVEQDQGSGMVLTDKSVQVQYVINIARNLKLLEQAKNLLKVHDFTWEVCQVIIHALYRYYDEYEKLPNFDILAYEVKRSALGQDQSCDVQIFDADFPILAEVMNHIRQTDESSLNPNWVMTTMREFQLQSRLRAAHMDIASALATGEGVEYVASKLEKIKENATAGRTFDFSDALDMEDMDVTEDEVVHLSTGMKKLDDVLSGGLHPDELVLIAAVQGVGKTNIMLNMGLSTALDGRHALFISLEMPKKTIKNRIMGMAAKVKANKFEQALSEFDTAELKRMEAAKSKLASRFDVLDLSKRQMTFAEIDQAVKAWTDKLEQDGVRDKAGMILIDYLDEISHGAEYGRGNTDSDAQVLKHLVGSLKKMSNRLKIPIVTATQGNRSADGKTIFKRSHIGWGFNKVDAIDLGIGVADAEDNRIDQLDMDGEDYTRHIQQAMEDGKEIVISSFKGRRIATPLAARMYIAPTLRVYDSEVDYKKEMNELERGKVFGS
jgi:replicative DNA helicase